jgi:hypothetical protein
VLKKKKESFCALPDTTSRVNLSAKNRLQERKIKNTQFCAAFVVCQLFGPSSVTGNDKSLENSLGRSCHGSFHCPQKLGRDDRCLARLTELTASVSSYLKTSMKSDDELFFLFVNRTTQNSGLLRTAIRQ